MLLLSAYALLVLVCAAFCVDPDEDRDAMGLISSKGYQAEQYEALTKDGYKLTLHRIPCRRNETDTPGCSADRPVVFLQHGLLCSSTNWLTNLANESFAYLLADAGFDVWLGNVRGNSYSRAHVRLDPAQKEFWAFSFDQFAQFDLPAMIDTALQVSGQKQLYYVGHSQGTMIGFIQFGLDQELAQKVKHFYALGPVATIGHIKGPLRILAYWSRTLTLAIKLLGENELLTNSWVFKALARYMCAAPLANPVCRNVLFLIAGYDSVQINSTRIPVYVSHSPDGTSAQNLIHFGQMVNSGKFQKFDYGWLKNKKVYNQATPPVYDVSKVKTPVSLYWGEEDWLADPDDIEKGLLPFLQDIQGNYKLKQTNHLDFLWGLRVIETVYQPIIKQMRAFEDME